jgi:hypothetical protein
MCDSQQLELLPATREGRQPRREVQLVYHPAGQTPGVSQVLSHSTLYRIVQHIVQLPAAAHSFCKLVSVLHCTGKLPVKPLPSKLLQQARARALHESMYAAPGEGRHAVLLADMSCAACQQQVG